MKTNRFSALSALPLLLALGGCGGALASTTPTGSSGPRAIEGVRSRAAAQPDDPAAQRLLAEWEIFGEGGDATRAEAALRRATELSPDDVGLLFAHAVLADEHAHPDEALDAYVAVLERAPRSRDPLAPLYVESSLGALEALRADARSFVPRIRPALEALVATPGSVGFAARRQALLWLRDFALQQADVAAATELERRALCPSAPVRVAGPFGPSVLASFDTRLPAEGPGPLAASYDLGPGRGPTDTRTVEPHFCAVALGGGRADGSGTRIVETPIHVDEAGRYVLAFAADGSLEIRIDDAQVARVDRRRQPEGTVSFHAVELTAGDHVMEVKLTSRDASPEIGWMLDRATPDHDPLAGTEIAPSDTPLARYLAASVLSLRGETIAARERLVEPGHRPRGVGSRERPIDPDFAPSTLLRLASRIVADDPFVAGTQREDDARHLAELALAHDPNALWAHLATAHLEANETDQLAALRAVATRFPLASVHLALSEALSEAGYEASAEHALAQAAEARPDSCPVLTARFDALIGRGRMQAAEELTAALVACDAREGSKYDLAIARRDWQAARAELDRLRPTFLPDRVRSLELQLARATGDAATEQRLLAEIEAKGQPGQYVLSAVDRRYAASDRRGASQLLAVETARSPRDASDLFRLSYALSGEDVMQAYRVDGREVVRRFEASGRSYEGYAAVLVFDYEVTRVFEDGSAIDLVHQIFRLQTPEGVERFATVDLHGRVLTVRAVSPDGRVREPDAIGDEGTAMPPLEVGDYVEYEYVIHHTPSWGDAFLSNGWSFQDFRQPFDHSEIVFVAPTSMPLAFDLRGPVPQPSVSEANGLRVSRFVMTEMRALTAEANAAAEPSVLPMLRAALRVTPERMFDAVRDRLLDLDPVDPAAERLLHDEILREANLPKAERARRIHRWVMEHVEVAENSFFGSAPEMLGGRAGSPIRVMRYLLGLADVPTRLAFARTLGSQTPNAQVPSTADYGTLVLLADVGASTPLYLFAAGRGMPFDYLPPRQRGQEAIVIEQGLPRVRLPETQGTAAAGRLAGDVEVDAEGIAMMHLVLSMSGAAGADLRSALREIPPSELASVLAERFVPAILPGAVGDPASIKVTGMDDWESEVAIEFVAISNGMVRRGRDGLSLAPLFQTGVDRNFASLPHRTTTELVGEIDVTVALRVRGPGVAYVPESRRLDDPSGASATLTATKESNGVVRYERRIRVPTTVIPVADYERFARFCRQAAQLEERTVRFAPN